MSKENFDIDILRNIISDSRHLLRKSDESIEKIVDKKRAEADSGFSSF